MFTTFDFASPKTLIESSYFEVYSQVNEIRAAWQKSWTIP